MGFESWIAFSFKSAVINFRDLLDDFKWSSKLSQNLIVGRCWITSSSDKLIPTSGVPLSCQLERTWIIVMISNRFPGIMTRIFRSAGSRAEGRSWSLILESWFPSLVPFFQVYWSKTDNRGRDGWHWAGGLPVTVQAVAVIVAVTHEFIMLLTFFKVHINVK